MTTRDTPVVKDVFFEATMEIAHHEELWDVLVKGVLVVEGYRRQDCV